MANQSDSNDVKRTPFYGEKKVETGTFQKNHAKVRTMVKKTVAKVTKKAVK
jgi:hypothetical protein